MKVLKSLHEAVYLAMAGVIPRYEDAGRMTDLRRSNLVKVAQRIEAERRQAMVRSIVGALTPGDG